LQTDGASRILAIHQLCHIRRDRHCELAIHGLIDVLDVVEDVVEFTVVRVTARELLRRANCFCHDSADGS